MSIDLKKAIGLGVAGNFAGHLEQAVKDIDFSKVDAKSGGQPDAPKGLFPIYVPANTGQIIEVFPLSSTSQSRAGKDSKLKIEPEVAIFCKLRYEGQKVAGITPISFTAYNDCSDYTPTVKKVSEKKNWGANSKGLSDTFVEIDHLGQGGILDTYRLACYLRRDGTLHTYGVDSPVVGYSYFHERLIDWIVDKMNSQDDTDPFEDISALLRRSNFPDHAIIGIGATRYTDFGESTYLETGDETFVVIYDSERYDAAAVEQLLSDNVFEGEGLVILRQVVE